jgi:hypothetical protein
MRFRLRGLRRLREHGLRRRETLRICLNLEILEDRLVPSADFVQTNLVSDISGMAATTDANLNNPWGLVNGPGGPWWIANQGIGTSTLYDGQGVPQPPGNNPPLTPLVATIPTNPNGSYLPLGSPTGIVFNTALATRNPGFVVSEGGKSGSSILLLDTLHGTMSGWSFNVDKTHAMVAVKQIGAVFTALAIGTDSEGNTLLYAVDNKNGVIDVYGQDFKTVTNQKGDFTERRHSVLWIGDRSFLQVNFSYLTARSLSWVPGLVATGRDLVSSIGVGHHLFVLPWKDLKSAACSMPA